MARAGGGRGGGTQQKNDFPPDDLKRLHHDHSEQLKLFEKECLEAGNMKGATEARRQLEFYDAMKGEEENQGLWSTCTLTVEKEQKRKAYKEKVQKRKAAAAELAAIANV